MYCMDMDSEIRHHNFIEIKKEIVQIDLFMKNLVCPSTKKRCWEKKAENGDVRRCTHLDFIVMDIILFLILSQINYYTKSLLRRLQTWRIAICQNRIECTSFWIYHVSHNALKFREYSETLYVQVFHFLNLLHYFSFSFSSFMFFFLVNTKHIIYICLKVL